MRKKILIPCLIIVLMLFFSVSNKNSVLNVNSESKESNFEIQNSQLQYVEHAPISIQNDSAFVSYGFPGTGNSSDPYIIENLNISYVDQIGIEVIGTTKFFVIRNCYFESVYTGIEIDSVTANTTVISNNTCVNSTLYGINVGSAPQSLIINNTCIDGLYVGIVIHFSSSSTVVNNTCNGNEIGIFSSNFLGSGQYVLFDNNECSNNVKGIDFDMFTNQCQITNCRLEANEIGIDASGSSNIITNNVVISNTLYGLHLNTIGDEIRNNNISFNHKGIYGSTYDSDISNNTFSFSYDRGLHFTVARDCVIRNNLIFNNSEHGLTLSSNTHDCEIINNTFLHNYHGSIQAGDSGDDNIFFDDDAKLGNIWSDWVGYGYYHISGASLSLDRYPSVLDSHIDNDNDSMPDNWEILVGLNNTLNDSDYDLDDDNLTNYLEYTIKTNPQHSDTDLDWLSDHDEYTFFNTDPLLPDTDNDGLTDGEEVETFYTNPLNPDTDYDGIDDGEEWHNYGTSPNDWDTDDDGLSDGDEIYYSTDPLDPDSDNDGLYDYEELFTYDTNPNDADSDNDGYNDGMEVEEGTNPNDPYSFPGSGQFDLEYGLATYVSMAVMCIVFLGLIGLGYFVVIKQRFI